MKSILFSLALAASSLALAQAPATAPAGSTGLCNDSTYTTAKTQGGACSGHQGVKQWFGQPTAMVPEQAGTPATATSVAPPATQAPMPPAHKSVASSGSHAGQVWLDEKSKMYYCAGSKEYGTTKQGEYMSEVRARGKGAHAAHGKTCS